ncbi:transcriptional regulator [Oligella urethralis]|uniref:LysR substrate-binding domain-containing protein n=1 Tax=Oligella urethralis TaxID=90245 RepID=UPI000CFF37CB|nr:LysR substrate-binding domain-containing protein [Oligella urethralis]AVL71397.1 transcriptional regulator [Oligella urethralis]
MSNFLQLPTLNALRTFTVAAHRLNFRQAADDLLVSPSAISHQIKWLEEYLGCQLFLRKNRTVELTEEGQFLFSRLKRPFADISQALSDMRMPYGRSRVNISLRPFVSVMWFTKMLGDLWLKHPSIQVNLIHNLQVPDFGRDNIDFAIVWGKAKFWPHLEIHQVVPGDLTPVCTPAYIEAHGPINSPDDLRKLTLIHDEGLMAWDEWFIRADGKPASAKKFFNIDDTNVRLHAVLDGQGIMLSCPTLLKEYLSEGKLILPFPDICLEDYAYFLAYSKDKDLSEQAAIFLNWIKSIV